MVMCHSKGAPETDGCCWVNGEICPLRFKLIDDRIYEGPALTDRGTTAEYAASISNSPRVQERILEQIEGTSILCRAAIEVLVNDARLLNDRAGFEAAWNEHPDYVALVRPAWEAIEQRLGLAPGEYQCSTYRGVMGNPQCCFAEAQEVNDEKAMPLTANARSLRRAGGT